MSEASFIVAGVLQLLVGVVIGYVGGWKWVFRPRMRIVLHWYGVLYERADAAGLITKDPK